MILVFILVPLIELYVIIKIGGSIGVGPTIALLLIDSMLGAFLLRHQGRAAWVSFNRAMAENRVPHNEVLDGVLVIFGAALLLTPGFITDIFGLILLIPPTRAIVRALIKRFALARYTMGPRAAMWGYGRMRGRRERRAPGREPPDPARARGSWNGAEDFGWTTPDTAGRRPGDIEGTAQEVRDDDEALPPGKSTSFPG
ncbi:MAG: FxsA family protein [Solirubrobacterales bacterium]